MDLDHQPCLLETTCTLATTECHLLNFPLAEQVVKLVRQVMGEILTRLVEVQIHMAHNGMNMLDY